MKKGNVWLTYTDADKAEMERICQHYKQYLNQGKTERECVALARDMAEQAGYCNMEEFRQGRRKVEAGSRIYEVFMNKCITLFRMGEEPLSSGMNILGAHIDSPRIDVKQNPLYENEGLAYLDTHYYGGIKKYQWLAQPLALHGVTVKKDGSRIPVVIGEDEEEPVFVITDLLVHLAQKQMEKTAGAVVEGENLDLLIANIPADVEKEPVKASVLKFLKETYDVEEEDFLSAELEIVPAGKARDLGMDRSMILAYGQDDRICAFTSLAAMLEVQESRRTACCILTDKEEIGSVGATGMTSRFFENLVSELIALTEGESELKTRKALSRSKMLSSDVSAAYDPLFPEVFDKKSEAVLSGGITFNKYTGSRGKNASNDANAEYIAEIRKIMDEAEVAYQFTEMGKVDAGGGGTIAHIMAKYGMNVIDCGVALLCMHAPYEVSSKSDIYQAVKGYRAFLKQED